MTRNEGLGVPAILAIDEGTTGTRAAWVTADGDTHALEYRHLNVTSPRAGVVEQDANEILEKTINACRAVVSQAAEEGVQLQALAIATQRSTAVLWDKESGQALVPAMVWQDSQYAPELAALAPEWDPTLTATVGRPTGVRSPYLWAAHQLRESTAVAEAYAGRRLGFGTIETWLLWNLTKERSYVATATNATSAGAYILGEHRYRTDWIEALGFPLDLLPHLCQDAELLGHTDEQAIGISVPVLAAIGDQHAGTIGLGCVDPGQAMCVHGTGSFVDLVTGHNLPAQPGLFAGTLTLTGWRRLQETVFAVETFTATTGSALDWVCSTLGWFDSAQQISELAATVESSNGVMFVPALTGIRTPEMEPRVRASLTGFSMSTTPAEVAYAVLEGIAHSVASSVEANAEVAGIGVTEIVVGGGMSGSDPLIQMQADLTGIPMRRLPGSELASLRGPRSWPVPKDCYGIPSRTPRPRLAAETFFSPASARSSVPGGVPCGKQESTASSLWPGSSPAR
ncbi:FGGY family carbohydrate kinase [Arthrobacter sp. 24S4-2]|uniref:FGGY family carbohydrate kinase n=1 Tax=Arthrobacter sp. 24S4-2 TaxID=2575374 RepID=UPI001C2F2C34|nr:FGGY family carbohydrate kinase [Arthrobacter sp. 24S4-2]